MNIVTKSVLTLSIGLALSSAVSAQTAPAPVVPKPTPSAPEKVEHSKHKVTAAATPEANKPLQPLAAGKQLPVKAKDSKDAKENKEASNLPPAKVVKHEKSVSSAAAPVTPVTPAVKPEPATKPSK